jgi:hypothetical protein
MYQAPPSALGQIAGAGITAMGAKQEGFFADGGLTGLALYNMSKDKS